MPDPLARIERAATRTRVPPDVRDAVFERDGHRCARCDKTTKLGLDHIVPVSKGGSDALENLRVLCASCNAWKGNREGEKYLEPLSPDAQRLLDELVAAHVAQQEAEREYLSAITDARKDGYSYAAIARAVGVSRQAVRQLLTRS